MKASELAAAMADAGAPMEAILIALRAIEERDETIEAKRAVERDRKRRQRTKERDVYGTVTGQSRDSHGDSPDTPSLSRPLSPQTPLTPTHTHPEYNTRTRKGAPLAKPEGVSEQVWADFLDHRKAKRAPVSQTVIDGIGREAEKIGWTLEAALAELVAQGWQGFKAEWTIRDASRGFPKMVNSPADVDPVITAIRAKRAALVPP